MKEQPHMPFCDGRAHGTDEEYDWDCVCVVTWDAAETHGPGEVCIRGIHADHVSIEVGDVGLYEPADVDRLVGALAVLRPLLAEARPYAECLGCSACDDDD
jgi:hypothetical protein